MCLLFSHQLPASNTSSHTFGLTMKSVDVHLAMVSIPQCCLHKLQVDWRLFKTVSHYRQPSPTLYIGSTSISVMLRESNRMSVFNKLSRREEVQAELAIRYWHAQSGFEQFSIIAVRTSESYKAAWIFEHCLIEAWQARLNYPFVQSALRRSAIGFRPAKRRLTAYGRFGRRLWRKLRKRQFGAFALARLQAWDLMFDLSSFTLASFNACTLLRSGRFVNDEVYAIIRLSFSLEEPLKTKVRKLLGLAPH